MKKLTVITAVILKHSNRVNAKHPEVVKIPVNFKVKRFLSIGVEAHEEPFFYHKPHKKINRRKTG